MTVKIKIFPAGKIIEVKKGTNLRQAIHEAGFTLESPCAGHGVCLKCGVMIDGIKGVKASTELAGKANMDNQAADSPGYLQSSAEHLITPEAEAQGFPHLAASSFHERPDSDQASIDAHEDSKALEGREMKGDWVLACQTEVLEPGTVIIPDTQRLDYKAVFSRFSRVTKLKPTLKKFRLNLPKPSLDDQRPDWQRLQDGLAEKGLKSSTVDLQTLASLPGKIRAGDFEVEGVLLGERLVDIRPASQGSSAYGLAVDIGTTSVAVMLIDLENGWIKGVESSLNEQVAYGFDVISRIDYSSKGSENLKELQRRIVQGINQLIGQLSKEYRIVSGEIYEMVVVGNTTMMHLFLGLEAKNMALSPYISATTNPHSLPARELGLDIHPAGEIHVLPGIASFVGSDTVAVILATSLHRSRKTILAIDLGTNGEVALAYKGRLYVASTAAGPAFEGGGIQYGMRAVKGAISSFSLENGEISYGVIGNTAPKGICGSGLIDIVASLYKAHIINNTGRLLSRNELGGGDPMIREIGKRIREKENKREFLLYSDYYGKEVVLTQQDIRQLQLAKGAVHAAVQVLKQIAGLQDQDIEKILLAGTFGNYVNAENAITIGLLPNLAPKDVKFIGNAALEGAMKALVNSSYRKLALRIARDSKYIELSGRSDFQEEFIYSLEFHANAVL